MVNVLSHNENGFSILIDVPNGHFVQQANRPIYLFKFSIKMTR